MFSMYDYKGPMHVVTVDCEILPDALHFCVVPTKELKSDYYISVYTLIFLPLFVTFVVFYAVVATYVWKQRIPVGKRAHAQASNATATSSRNKNDAKKDNKANTKMPPRYVFKSNNTSNTGSRSTLLTDSSCETPLNRRRNQNSDVPETTPNAEHTVRTVHTKRKVRTFKVIMVLIATCFIGRVPSWTFTVASSDPDIRLDSMEWWLLQFWFTILSLFSTALNPFLYCFLNETLEFIQAVFKFIRDIFGYCCICWKKETKVNVEREKQEIVEEEKQHIRSISIVPRGPYLNNEEHRPGAFEVSVEVNHI